MSSLLVEWYPALQRLHRLASHLELDRASFVADAFLTFMKYDNAKEQILKTTKVDLHLLQTIEARIFDGTIGREGIDILAEVFKSDDLRRIMLNPRNPSSLRDDSWNFGSKVTLMKATDHFLEKIIHGLVREPAMVESDKPEYPGHYWDLAQDDRNNSASLCSEQYYQLPAHCR